MNVEGGVHRRPRENRLTPAVNGRTAVGAHDAQEVRTVVGQATRLAQIEIIDAGASSGTVVADLQGSLDGTVWFDLGTQVSELAAFEQLEQVIATPWVRLNIVSQSSTPLWQVHVKVSE